MLRQAVPTGKQPCQARHLHPVAAAGRTEKLQTRTQEQDQHEAQTPALAGPLYQHAAPLHCCCCCCHAILQLQHQLQRCKGRRPIWGAAKEVCDFAHLWPLYLACSTAPRPLLLTAAATVAPDHTLEPIASSEQRNVRQNNSTIRWTLHLLMSSFVRCSLHWDP